MVATAAPAAGERGFFESIALIRAVAALLVVYDHFCGIWPERNGIAFAPAQAIERWVLSPLALMQLGGAMAVALFFMVSGFIIVYVGVRESPRAFAIRRTLRIFPPLWVSIALLLMCYVPALALSDAPGLRGYQINEVLAHANPWPYVLAAATLVNYVIGTPAVNGVAWTLIIEMLFYLCVLALLPLLRTRPRAAMIAAFAALALLQAAAKTNGFVFLVAVNGVYVSFLFLGTLVYLRWAGRIGNVFFVAATAAFWALFLFGVDRYVAQPPWTVAGYGVSYAFAWLLFVALLLVDKHVRLDPVTAFFSRISYSLYLNHGGLGLLALTLLVPRIGYPAALVLTFAMAVAVSAASYRFVEVPSQALARRWSHRTKRPGEAIAKA
jgi:peptidoglycan/LPS O-acetylase OafA/YrhL